MDQLYINDVEIPLPVGTVFALTLQINDLAELKDRQSSRSQQVKVPKTKTIIKALEYANILQSDTSIPYQRNTAKLYKNGVQVFSRGFAVLESVDKFFNITIYSGLIDFFETIDKRKLSDLDYSDLDHLFSITNILNSFPNVTGYKYPLINYGHLVNTDNIVEHQNLRPAIFTHWLIDKIYEEALFTKGGEFFSDENYLKLLIPFSANSETVYYNHSSLQLDSNWNDLSVTPYGSTQTIQKMVTGQTMTFRVVMTFTVANWVPGSTFNVFVTNSTGSFGGSLYDHNAGAAANGTFTIDQSVTITALSDETLYFRFDFGSDDVDITQCDLYGQDDNDADFNFRIHVIAKSFSVAFGLTEEWLAGTDLRMALGETTWELDKTVPDMSQKELVKTIANQFGLFFARDPFTNTIYSARLIDIMANIPKAIDWSDKLHNDKETWTLNFRHEKYAQKNYLKYKKDSSDNDITPETGNGSFLVADEILRPETTLIELPFAATHMGKYLGGYDVPLIRKLDPDDLTSTEMNQSTEPRMLIDDTQDTTDPIHYEHNGGGADFTADIPFCYFQLATKAFNLGFDDSLLNDYYQQLVDMLQKFKKITVSFKLNANDIAQFETIDPNTNLPYWFTPRYVHQFSSFFYVNKIENFKGSDSLTRVELIRFGVGDVCIPEYSDELLTDGDFPNPNVIWSTSGDLGVSFTFGIPGVQKDNPGSFNGLVDQSISPITSPVGKFKAVITITGRTQGECYVQVGSAVGTVITDNGTFTEIHSDVDPVDTFKIYMDADFDGVMTLASLRAQLTCP